MGALNKSFLQTDPDYWLSESNHLFGCSKEKKNDFMRIPFLPYPLTPHRTNCYKWF